MTPAAASILRMKLKAAPSFSFSTPRRDQTGAKGWVGGRVDGDGEGDVDGGGELAQKGQSPRTDRHKRLQIRVFLYVYFFLS